MGSLGSDYSGGGGDGGRYSDIFKYIEVRSIIFGSKFQKSNTFGNMKICGFFFFCGEGSNNKIGLLFYLFFFLGGGGGSFLYILGLLKVKIQNGNIFWRQNFKYFGYA